MQKYDTCARIKAERSKFEQETISRRRFISATGLSTAAILAGCSKMSTAPEKTAAAHKSRQQYRDAGNSGNKQHQYLRLFNTARQH